MSVNRPWLAKADAQPGMRRPGIFRKGTRLSLVPFFYPWEVACWAV